MLGEAKDADTTGATGEVDVIFFLRYKCEETNKVITFPYLNLVARMNALDVSR